jgi:formylglycine-generating enzyme required for sulfatase activity
MKGSFTLPMLEWCNIPAGWVTIEFTYLHVDAAYHKEHFVEAFRISKYPVTFAQFQAFIDAPDGFYNEAWWQAHGSQPSAPGRQAWPIDNHPRETVSWYDAVAFCFWLSDKTGLAISLPTEQQWQRAAQGDDGHEYPWGNEFGSSRCNTFETDINRTTPVDQYPNGISPYGVYDMAGNVWEWCLNEWENPERAGLAGGPIRVLRGGSWSGHKLNARCACRNLNLADNRATIIGFRVVTYPQST